jgi:hypothetical protein
MSQNRTALERREETRREGKVGKQQVVKVVNDI